jgi:stage III sporulation protein AH
MIYFIYNKKTSVILALGLILLLLILIGRWYYVNNMPERVEEQPFASVEVKLQQQAENKNSSEVSETVKKQEFFVDCRLTRDRMRSQQLDVLKEIAGNPASSEETREKGSLWSMLLPLGVGLPRFCIPWFPSSGV